MLADASVASSHCSAALTVTFSSFVREIQASCLVLRLRTGDKGGYLEAEAAVL